MSGFLKRISAPLVAIGFVLTLSGCSTSNQPASAPSSPAASPKKITSAGVVNAAPQSIELPAGTAGEAVVRLTIQKGYHLNANPPTFSYLKATELVIKPAEGITVGKLVYPPALKGKFAFSEDALDVYEGEVQLKAELKADKGASAGSRTLSAILHIQACDDQVCYPPGKIDLQIPVTVK
ncbi:MAG TPA: protein-disulfide reductase DsbD N-terminal domain-containing protein [Pyrinomonadaceae bacterium]|nr:protein-disulfide reductase DsbD N-terminal domain-containing protein [Pyrinomonadaceae bacterium]